MTKYKIGSVFYVGLFDSRKKDQNGNNHFIGYLSFAWEHETNWKESDLLNMIKENENIEEVQGVEPTEEQVEQPQEEVVEQESPVSYKDDGTIVLDMNKFKI